VGLKGKVSLLLTPTLDITPPGLTNSSASDNAELFPTAYSDVSKPHYYEMSTSQTRIHNTSRSPIDLPFPSLSIYRLHTYLQDNIRSSPIRTVPHSITYSIRSRSFCSIHS